MRESSEGARTRLGVLMSETVRDAAPVAFWRCRWLGGEIPESVAHGTGQGNFQVTHCLGCGMVPGAETLAEAAVPPAGKEITHAPGASPGPVRASIGRISGFFTWTWAVLVLVVLLLIRWVGDRWWGVAVVLFLPRWLFLQVLLPVLAMAQRPRADRPKHSGSFKESWRWWSPGRSWRFRSRFTSSGTAGWKGPGCGS